MSQIQQVKDATDIVAVIGDRVNLKRAGSYFKGLCPFHGEKTPSFTVSESMQRYKCFGCGESGDVLSFLQKYDGLSFYESLKTLADQAHIELSTVRRTPEDELREQVIEVLDLSKRYYHYLLTKHQIGQKARDYLKSRHISNESITLFQLGYAPPAWEGLTTYLTQKKGYSLNALEAAGLVIRSKTGRCYDRFRDRVVFPLRNTRSIVVGFSGRSLSPDVKEAKYINSPETSVYHKSKLLFGYSEARQFIRKKQEIIVVEGEFDVVTSMQVHVNNIVAIKGSALTQDHAKLIGRLAQRVLLALDTDSAGVEATKKAIAVLQNHELELRVILLPDGKDPDELIRTNPKAWRDAVKSSVSGYDFLIETAFTQYKGQTASEKKSIIQALAPVFSYMSHGVELDYYQKKLAVALKVSKEIVQQDLHREQKKISFGTKKSEKEHQAVTAPTNSSLNPQEKMEHYFFFLLFRIDVLKASQLLEKLSEYVFRSSELEEVRKILENNTQQKKFEILIKTVTQTQQELMFSLYMSDQFADVAGESVVKELNAVIRKLLAFAKQKKRQAITQQLEQLDLKGDLTIEEEMKQQRLLEQLVKLR